MKARPQRHDVGQSLWLNFVEMADRHHLIPEDYLSRVFFYQRRLLARGHFWKVMSVRTKPFPRLIELLRPLLPDSR